MRKQKHLIIIALMLMLTVLTQCKKYPDDEGGSTFPRTAKERLCRTWYGGSSYSSWGRFTFNRNGTVDYFPFAANIANGNWKFMNDENTLRITYPNNNNNFDFTILRLEKYQGQFYLTLRCDSALIHVMTL
jgi:hypothetical protein